MAKTSVTSWEVSNALWERVELLIPASALRRSDIPAQTWRWAQAQGSTAGVRSDRLRVTARAASGRRWPVKRFGSASAVHKRFLDWQAAGVFEALWKVGLAEYDDMEDIALPGAGKASTAP